MKYIYYASLTFLLSTVSVHAQIGIYTENVPTNILVNIDPLKNNNQSGALQENLITDDIFIANDGNIGIGTSTPTTKLHIKTDHTAGTTNPQFAIIDGKQNEGYILKSDVKGAAFWNSDYVPSALGNFSTKGVSISGTEKGYKSVDCNITLDPGLWMVFYTLTIQTSTTSTLPITSYKIFVNSTLGDSPTATTSTADIRGASVFGSPILAGYKGTIIGRCIIENNTDAPLDYYILVGNITNASSITGISLTEVGKQNSSSSFYALRIKDLTTE